MTYETKRLKSMRGEVKKAQGHYEASLKAVEAVMKEAVEIVNRDPQSNHNLLTTLAGAKEVFAGEDRPSDQRIADQEYAVLSLTNVVDLLVQEVRNGFTTARSTEGGALAMVTGLVGEQRTDMRELQRATGRIEGGLGKVMAKTVEGNAQLGGQLKIIVSMLQQILPPSVGGVLPVKSAAKTDTPLGSPVREEIPETPDADLR